MKHATAASLPEAAGQREGGDALSHTRIDGVFVGAGAGAWPERGGRLVGVQVPLMLPRSPLIRFFFLVVSYKIQCIARLYIYKLNYTKV